MDQNFPRALKIKIQTTFPKASAMMGWIIRLYHQCPFSPCKHLQGKIYHKQSRFALVHWILLQTIYLVKRLSVVICKRISGQDKYAELEGFICRGCSRQDLSKNGRYVERVPSHD